MRKYYISEIDLDINEGRNICVDVAMRRIQNHIIKKIDPTFPITKFQEWYNSDTEKPFRWNKNLFYWSK